VLSLKTPRGKPRHGHPSPAGLFFWPLSNDARRHVPKVAAADGGLGGVLHHAACASATRQGHAAPPESLAAPLAANYHFVGAGPVGQPSPDTFTTAVRLAPRALLRRWAVVAVVLPYVRDWLSLAEAVLEVEEFGDPERPRWYAVSSLRDKVAELKEAERRAVEKEARDAICGAISDGKIRIRFLVGRTTAKRGVAAVGSPE
jgi:hypothetical protein